MKLFHKIKTVVPESLITKANNHYQIKVFWTVEFNEDLIPFLSSKRREHNPELLQRGVGSLIVEVPFTKFEEMAEAIAYAEGNAQLYLVEKTGQNVFGVEGRGVKPQKLQLKLSVSSPLIADLIKREDTYVSVLQKSPKAHLLGLSDYLAAYFYGSEVEVSGEEDQTWADPYIDELETPEYFGAVRSNAVRRLLDINTPIGIVHMTYRTVQEFLNMPLNRELVEVKGQVFGRPYESAVERVVMATSVVPPENDHMKKLVRKFPDKQPRALFSKTPPTFVDLFPLQNAIEPHFIVIGYRALYAQETLKRLEEGGFTYHK